MCSELIQNNCFTGLKPLQADSSIYNTPGPRKHGAAGRLPAGTGAAFMPGGG